MIKLTEARSRPTNGCIRTGAVRNAFTDKDWALKFQSRVKRDDGDINLILLKQQLRGFVLILLVAVWTNDYFLHR